SPCLKLEPRAEELGEPHVAHLHAGATNPTTRFTRGVSNPCVAAGMIADAVKSRGRSRHGQLAAAAMTVDRVVGARAPPTCSGRQTAIAHLLPAAAGAA